MNRSPKVGGGCYEGTNITGEKAVKGDRTQLNDALMECCRAERRTLDNLLEGDRRLPEIGCGDQKRLIISSRE